MADGSQSSPHPSAQGGGRARLALPDPAHAASGNHSFAGHAVQQAPDSGLRALASVAGYFRIPADPIHLRRELALGERETEPEDVARAAGRIGLKARILRDASAKRLRSVPVPAILRLRTGGFVILGGVMKAVPNPPPQDPATAQEASPAGTGPAGSPGEAPEAVNVARIMDPVTGVPRILPLTDLFSEIEPLIILVARKLGGPGVDPKAFSLRWFLPSLWRYRRPLGHVLLASLFVQIFALVTPLMFQVVIDKVLAHKSYSTLFVIVAGLAGIGLFDVILQYLRTYALAHTTNRIDVELGQRLFGHLMRLPMGYFETRPAGQTVARMRELETIRAFLTGQGLFAALDLVFTVIFIAVLFAYSVTLAWIVVATIPLYLLIAAAVRPGLHSRIEEKFNKGAESQQFLVESVVGMQTLKAAAVEPVMQAQWEEKLAAYVRTTFSVTLLGGGGQMAIQYVSKLSTAALLLFGAKAVIDGEMSVGALVAFNMIAGQVSQPVLRLSQIWQDFQQVRISLDRMGDILNAAPEPTSRAMANLPPPKGALEFRRVSFRYTPGGQEILKDISLQVRPGEVVGIVGPSGSGKSTLTKLVQRLYLPNEGQVLLDGVDLSQVDPAWLRRHIGVVLQENLLFNRTIHDNIALANPALPRAHVIQMARLAGADEFVAKLPRGYDTMIEERGANLSGGQRQRLAIARALVTNPPILIFDEATSALDYESERVVQTNMERIVKGRTVLIIAHRLAAVRPCHRIIGMVDGRIVEQGSHEELLRHGGLYAKLWSLQGERAA
jgi:ATP-binding cassette, subfamily B, bacterial HlyB/CyaB